MEDEHELSVLGIPVLPNSQVQIKCLPPWQYQYPWTFDNANTMGLFFSFMKHLNDLNLNYFATNIMIVGTDKRNHQ